MVQVPIGFELETNIEPVAELTLMRSVSATSECPSELSTPVYVHVVAYDPQLRLAENGVIGRFQSDTPCATVKADFDQVTVFTVNGL